MKEIILLRHSKTEETNPKGDFYRNLTPVGIERMMAQKNWWTKKDFSNTFLLLSTANRALQTYDLIKDWIHIPKEHQYRSKELYLAEPEVILHLIQEVDDKFSSVMVIGHNPGVVTLAHWLDKKFQNELKPGSRALFEGDIKHWSNCKKNTFKFIGDD